MPVKNIYTPVACFPSVKRVLSAYETRSAGEEGVVKMDNEVSAKTIASDYEFYYKQPYFEQKNKEKLVFYSKFSYLCGEYSCIRQIESKFSLRSFAKLM
ncbi:hypothetical protein CLI70_07500 [Prevotella intermedia]|nr:hypothetical protein CLI70_07500 [Prevotella intermedia]